MFTFKSKSPNGINGTAKYLVDVFMERPHADAAPTPRYEVYAAVEEVTLTDGVDSPLDSINDRLTASGGPFRRLLGGMEAHQGKIDGSHRDDWFYRVDHARGLTREIRLGDFDWNEQADWLIGATNPSGEIYDLAHRFFSFGNLVGYGITPLFNEQFIDLGA